MVTGDGPTRCQFHIVQEQQAIVGSFCKDGIDCFAAVKNTAFCITAKAGTPRKWRVAKRRGKQVVQIFAPGQTGRFALLQQLLQHLLFLQAVHQASGSDLFLGFDNPVKAADKTSRGCADFIAQINHTLPRIASR